MPKYRLNQFKSKEVVYPHYSIKQYLIWCIWATGKIEKKWITSYELENTIAYGSCYPTRREARVEHSKNLKTYKAFRNKQRLINYHTSELNKLGCCFDN